MDKELFLIYTECYRHTGLPGRLINWSISFAAWNIKMIRMARREGIREFKETNNASLFWGEYILQVKTITDFTIPFFNGFED